MPWTDLETLVLAPRRPTARWSQARMLAIAASLILHLAALAWLLLAPVEPMPRRALLPRSAATAPSMQLVLIEARPARAPPPSDAASILSQPRPAAWRAPPLDRTPPPATAANPHATPAAPPQVSAARLFDSIPLAARLPAPKAPPRGSGPVPLPGGAEPLLALPLHHREALSPEQIVNAIGRFVIGGVVVSDRIGDVRDGSDPLRRWTEARMQDAVDPVCNDPEHPRIDARCLKAEE